MFGSQDIQVFVFLTIPWFTKSVTPCAFLKTSVELQLTEWLNLAISLYWFAEHKQTDTFWWQKLDYFYQKFSTEFN